MIDWIKIRLENFTGNLDNCRREMDRVDEKTGVLYENYILPNCDYRSPKQHRMKISRQAGSKKIYVKGSVRKWCYHRDTYSDLTAQKFEDTMKKLALKLNITFEELCRATFTQCEIGLNITTRIPCCKIIPMIVRYGSIKKNGKKGREYESVYFTGTAKELKLYDKRKEVEDNAIGASNRQQLGEMSRMMREHNYNLLRIEFTLYDHNSFTQHKLGHIKTIGDLITYYSDLYKFWCREVNRLILYDPTTKPDRNRLREKKDYERAWLLALHGFEQAIKLNERDIDKNKPTASVSRSKALRKLLAVVNKFYPDTYNTQTLRLDIARNLTHKCIGLCREIPINECYRALWIEKMVNNKQQ